MKKHGDILFLERRLNDLVDREEYEKAAIVKRWIDELTIFYHGDEKIINRNDLSKIRK